MDGAFLEPIYAFGFGGPHGPGWPCQLGCVSASTTVYAAGKVLAFYSEERNPPLRFTTANANVEGITAVVVSPSGRQVAACEKVRGAGQVTIFDTRSRQKVKTLTTAFVGDFTTCTFSPDGESLLTVANDEAGMLTCWDLQKSKVLATAAVGSDVTRISFNKTDPTEIATTGPRVFKLWRWNEKGLKPVSVAGITAPARALGASGRQSSASSTPKTNTTNPRSPTSQKQVSDYTDHAWLTDGTLAVANRDGVVFLIAEGQVQQKLNHNGPVYCLAAVAQGFLAGSVLGRLLRYQAPDTNTGTQEWGKQEVTAGSGKSAISCIVVDATEATAKIVLEGESVMAVSLTAMEAERDSSKVFTPMLTGFHSGEVLGLDVCSRRCLLASVSTDQSIRVWDYRKWTPELVHTLEEEPRAVAFNPWGYQLLVALPQRVLVCDILVSKLQVASELNLKDCTKLKYSPSGHLAAAATPRELTVFSALTWAPLAVFRGHSKAVSSLCWSSDSLFLVSADAHGTIYSWSMERLARAEESVIKGSDYTCVLYNDDRTALMACGASTPLRVFDTGKQQPGNESGHSHSPAEHGSGSGNGWPTSSLRRESKTSVTGGSTSTRSSSHPTEAVLRNVSTGFSSIIRTNIVGEHFGGHSATVWMAKIFSKGLLATGARNGALSLRQFPLVSDSPVTFPELLLHSGPLTGLCSEDNSGLVFSSSLDGIIFAATLAQKRDRGTAELTSTEAATGRGRVGEEAPATELVLVQRSMLSDEEREKEELRSGLQKLSDEAAYKLHRVEQDAQLRLRQCEEAHERTEMGLRQTLKEHEKASIEAQEQYQNTLAAEQLHKEDAVREATDRGEAKLLREARRADGLAAELAGLKRDLDRRVAAKLAEAAAETEIVLQKHCAYEGTLLTEIEKLQKEATSKLRKAETQLVEEFEINEEELHNVVTRARVDYEAQVQRTFEARGQAIFERNKAAEAEGRKIALEQEVRERQEHARKLELENAVMRDKIGSLEAHRRDTDQLLLDKEDEILRMRKTIGEHEAYALIRDTKIKKLESTEEPLKVENTAQKQKLAEAEEREAAFAAEFWTWQEAQRFLRAKVASQEREMESLRNSLHRAERTIDLFTADLCKVVRDQDSSEWPRMIKALYAAYVDEHRSAEVAEAKGADDEILRQKRCLERFVKVLKDAMARNEEKTHAAMERLQGENVVLLTNLADSSRKAAKLQALLRQQQARVAHSRAIQRGLHQKLREAGVDESGPQNPLDDPDEIYARAETPNEWGDENSGNASKQDKHRVAEKRLPGQHGDPQPEASLEMSPPSSPLPRLPHFPRTGTAPSPAASGTAHVVESDRPLRPAVTPKRLTSALVVRPGTAAAGSFYAAALRDARPATAAVETRPLETSVSEASLMGDRRRPNRLTGSPSLGRLAKGPALVGAHLTGTVRQLGTERSSDGEGHEEQKGQRASFRRATSLRRKSSLPGEQAGLDLGVQNVRRSDPGKSAVSGRPSDGSTTGAG